MKLAKFTRRCLSAPISSSPTPQSSSSSSCVHGGVASSGYAAVEGEVLRMEHTFKQDEVATYAAISGDSNPIHTHQEAAVSVGFKGCVVHGMLCAGLFPSIIRSRFPRAFFESKTLRFKEPALVGDCLEAEAKVLHIHSAKNGLSVEFSMECYKKDGRVLVLEGKSTVRVPISEYSKWQNV